MHCIFILLDGLGDRSYKELNWRTPLQAAMTPNLDYLARRGCCGLFHAREPGYALPSENAHFAMFGYRPEEFPGRGFLEALGADVPLADEEVAILSHFVSVVEADGVLILQKDRPRAAQEEVQALVKVVTAFRTGDIEVRYRPTFNLDGVVVMSGAVAPQITDSDPLFEGQPLIEILPLANAPFPDCAEKTAAALKKYLVWCYEQLAAHPVNRERVAKGLPPVNGLVTQRAGQRLAVEPFPLRWGLRGLSIASGLVYWGLARYLGLDVCQVNDSKDPGADLQERIMLALDKKNEYEFIHVHTKAPDAAAHTKDPLRKVEVIEALDRGLEQVVAAVDGDSTLFLITADHSTPSRGPLVHSGEHVPLMFVGPGVRQDSVRHFDEVQCAGGGLGTLTGRDIMPLVLNFLDRIKLQGLMDCPVDYPYWPGPRQPFRIR